MKGYVKSSRSQAFVGIWWYTDEGRVIGAMCDVNDGYLDGRFVQYSQFKNHMNLWKYLVYHEFDNESADRTYDLGYRGLERGRVIYDTMTQVFMITCSEAIASNEEALSDIKDAFSLSGNRCEVEVLNHYKKLPLTGNPAVDEQILNMDI